MTVTGFEVGIRRRRGGLPIGVLLTAAGLLFGTAACGSAARQSRKQSVVTSVPASAPALAVSTTIARSVPEAVLPAPASSTTSTVGPLPDTVITTAAPAPSTPPTTTSPTTTSPTTTSPTTTSPTTTTPTTTPAPAVTPPPFAQQSAALDQLPTYSEIAPVRLRIEGQTIDAPVVPVTADPTTSELSIPPVHDAIGWYQYGPTPGDPGSAVLAAHVDWKGQLGVFFTLNKVPIGATVVVTLEDGSERQFAVSRREEIAKTDLPVQEVFAKTGPAQLVLITCGGKFNRTTHHYADNFILIATPIGTSTT